MKIGPKFKIAKRLGAPIFEKTQTQKFAVSQARAGRKLKHGGMMSDYKRQLLEKQKMRLSYGLTEKQLRRYVDEALEKSSQPTSLLMERLETRLDNTVYRIGLAKTRRMARQMVSHGHITVNSTKSTIPSQKVRVGDIISVREGSKSAGLFTNFGEKAEVSNLPGWLTFDQKKMTASVTGMPQYNAAEYLFDPEQVFEFYSR